MGIFTIYALNLAGEIGTDTETECATLDEALTHLRELATSELEAPPHDGPIFDRYGLYFERSDRS